jgi:tRNA (guanine37-N1)-methyltransferase
LVFHVLSLYKSFIDEFAKTGVIGRAQAAGAIQIHSVDVRDYSLDRNRRVDDYPYGGGAGMVMACQPVVDCVESVKEGREAPVFYFSPRGRKLTAGFAKECAAEPELILLCGHFEGVDERAIRETGALEVSVGDYVLTGGHLAACVFVDCVARFVPGVLGNGESAAEESFENGLLEYPHYTRPASFRGMRVPEELLSGSHALIHDWRRAESLEATRKARPDLFRAHLEKARSSWPWKKK